MMSSYDLDDEYSIIESAHEAIDRSDSVNDSQPSANNHYIEEYISLFHGRPDCLRSLRESALKHGLRSCRFRSICWRIFLECLPESSDERVAKISELRSQYETIRGAHNRDPRVDIHFCDNPLSQEDSSQWHRYFSDAEMRLRITQDVVRTFPEIDFFQLPAIQALMVSILFHYARENPHIEYKQGMHELLAPLLFVIHCDQQTYLHAEELGLIEDELTVLLNPDYLEHDAYYLFSQVMETVESWYQNQSIQSRADLINVEPFSAPPESNLCSVLGVKLKMINEQIVRRFDHELYHHLQELEIMPQIYGIRWMRLLFGREFQMQDLLVVWDALFADGIAFALCDYVFAAMLIIIRKVLLAGDYAECLHHLMRYPSVPDIHYVIHLALHIKDPLNYSEPVGYSSLVMPNALNVTPIDLSKLSPLTPRPPQQLSALHTTNNILRSNSLKSNGLRPAAARPTTLALSLSNSRPFFTSKTLPIKRQPSKELRHITVSADSHNDDDRSVEMNSNGSSRQDLAELRAKTEYCWKHMTGQLDSLQRCLAREQLEQEDEAMIALAELKKVRDILKGTLKFSPVVSGKSGDH